MQRTAMCGTATNVEASRMKMNQRVMKRCLNAGRLAPSGPILRVWPDLSATRFMLDLNFAGDRPQTEP
jgi:hypothetical protein